MVSIDTPSSLESFRKFVMSSTCDSFAPKGYLDDEEVFAEREDELGSIYVEAADKVTLKKVREITFVNAVDILGIIYTSKSGNTRLMWRQTRRNSGRVTGEASNNSLVNLAGAGVIHLDSLDEYAERSAADA